MLCIARALNHWIRTEGQVLPRKGALTGCRKMGNTPSKIVEKLESSVVVITVFVDDCRQSTDDRRRRRLSSSSVDVVMILSMPVSSSLL